MSHMDRDFSLLQIIQPGFEAHQDTCSVSMEVYCQRIMLPGRGAEQSSSSNFELQNEWIYTSALSIVFMACAVMNLALTLVIKWEIYFLCSLSFLVI
jgi:hypothetical protein